MIYEAQFNLLDKTLTLRLYLNQFLVEKVQNVESGTQLNSKAEQLTLSYSAEYGAAVKAIFCQIFRNSSGANTLLCKEITKLTLTENYKPKSIKHLVYMYVINYFQIK